MIAIFLPVGSTTSSTALQNEGELGDDDVFTVSALPTHWSLPLPFQIPVVYQNHCVATLSHTSWQEFCYCEA